MQAFQSFVQAHRSLLTRFLLACLLAGFVFTLASNLLSSQTESAHQAVRSSSRTTSASNNARFALDRYDMPMGRICTDNCTGGYEVVPYSSFTEAFGVFQIPPCPAQNGAAFADIWVELGGDGQGGASPQAGLAAGVIMGGFDLGTVYGAELVIDSVGPGGDGMHAGAMVNCGDLILAEATATWAITEDLSNGLSLTVTRSTPVYNQDAQCIVQMGDPNYGLYNFGTLSYNGPCEAYDPSVGGWQQFGYYGGSYLWLDDNFGNTLAGDPNASRSGIGSVEQIQWYRPI